VLDLLEGVPAIERMLVMVQREVGERLAAGVGDDAYGAVSVKVAYWATASVVGKVPATVFVPQPRVESALVTVARRPTPAVDVPYGRFEALVRAGFATRRKMLRRALAGVVAVDVLEAAGVDPSWRAEQLDVDAWGRLTACAMSAGPPPS
jgi:16S rRNA (adenine1518-N6/adenine1519-N6)-dimethyltransferase